MMAMTRIASMSALGWRNERILTNRIEVKATYGRAAMVYFRKCG